MSNKFYDVYLPFRNIIIVIKVYFLDRAKSYITEYFNDKIRIILNNYYNYRRIDKISI